MNQHFTNGIDGMGASSVCELLWSLRQVIKSYDRRVARMGAPLDSSDCSGGVCSARYIHTRLQDALQKESEMPRRSAQPQTCTPSPDFVCEDCLAMLKAREAGHGAEQGGGCAAGGKEGRGEKQGLGTEAVKGEEVKDMAKNQTDDDKATQGQ